MKDIRDYNTFKKIERINKGWSDDKKYYVGTNDGKQLLLRISDFENYDRKKFEFEMMEQVVKTGIPMATPIDFGICENGKNVYSIFTWCSGVDADQVLPQLSEMKQYMLGLQYGKTLKKIHSIPAPTNLEDWESLFNKNIDIRLKQYEECYRKFRGSEKVIKYIEENRHLLKGRPKCFQHGDYHVGNLVMDENLESSIIDFNRLSFGDPWEEFNRVVFSARVSPYFANGQIDGYFDGKPPLEFFKLMALYMASNASGSIHWAMAFGEDDVKTMTELNECVVEWYSEMENPIPKWYKKDLYLRSPQDNFTTR